MVGLGEDKGEVLQVMDDLRAAEVDFLTIGQYLQPTPKHHAIARFVTPDEFRSYASFATAKGFLLVSASPLTRSSYHAGEDFARLRAARAARLAAGYDPPRCRPTRRSVYCRTRRSSFLLWSPTSSATQSFCHGASVRASKSANPI